MENVFYVSNYAQQGQNAIQAAVNACGEAGGGKVIVPTGEWKSGPIHLRSNICLELEKGAVIQFSDKPEDYLPVVFTRWEGMECYNYSPLMYARDCENVAVIGEGALMGNGQSWWHWKKLQQDAAKELCYAESEGIPVEKRVYGTEQAALRPSFIQFMNCKNVRWEDFTIIDGPQWTLHPVYCEDMVIRNVKVSTHGHNTDGLNPDSCKNVLIEGCSFETGDDCIAINSGMNEDGWRVGKPCENIEIRNCTMTGGHGAIVIGSAMSGGVKNIYAHDCKISDTMQGIRLKSMRGRGGYVDGAVFENIEIENTTVQAIEVNMFYQFSTVMPKTEVPPAFKNIVMKNVKGSSLKTGIEIKGLPDQKLEDITLENVSLTAKDLFTCVDVDRLKLINVELIAAE